jgi:hypothetical protein
MLQSRNAGVVVAVGMSFFYLAPAADSAKVGKALVRIIRNSHQVAYFVLSNVLTMSHTRPVSSRTNFSETIFLLIIKKF